MFGNNLDNLLNSISAQFGVSRGGIVAFLVGLASIILFIILSSFIQSLATRRRRMRYSKRIFALRAEKLKISDEQTRLLHDLSSYLADPALSYLLFRDPVKFNYCSRKLLEDRPGDEQEVAALRVTLGLSGETNESLPVSTASLNPGQHVTCLKGGLYRSGIVRKQNSDGVTVQVQSAAGMEPNDILTVFFTMPRGRFEFSSPILARKDNLLLIGHSEQIRLSQNRNYYRREYSGILMVRKIDGPVDPMQFACIDLGGGGLSFISRDGGFLRGDLLRCKLGNLGSFTLRVVRTSRKGRLVHGEFEEIDSQTRDRIFHELFQPGRRSS